MKPLNWEVEDALSNPVEPMLRFDVNVEEADERRPPVSLISVEVAEVPATACVKAS